VVLNAQFIAPYAPREVLQAGSAFLAADRATQGIMPTMSVSDNLTICDVGRHSRGGRLRHKEERKEVHGWIDRLRVKTAGSHAPIGTLSGGNQQKVLFARGLRLKPSVLVLDEPTRGIDVSAKEEIHAIVDNAAAEGAAVLVTSTDTDELVRLSSRVVVLVGGRLVAELTGADITVENIERAQLEIRTIAHATTGTPIEDHA
jgi:ribose transport system ATP-binding protein